MPSTEQVTSVASFPSLDDPFPLPDRKPPPNHVSPQLCQWKSDQSYNERRLGLGASLTLSISCLSPESGCLSHLCLSLCLHLSLCRRSTGPHTCILSPVNAWHSSFPKFINDFAGSKRNDQLGRGNEPRRAKLTVEAVRKANTNCSNYLAAVSACHVCLQAPPLNTDHLLSRAGHRHAF